MTEKKETISPTPTRVLVIDDEKSVCLSCKRILEEDRHFVAYETSAAAGLKRAIEEDFEVVLLDLKMPEMTGMQALEMIMKERPDLTVIIITGYATISTSIEAIKKGAFNYVPKPFTPEELSVAVSKAVQDRRVRLENAYLKEEISRLKNPMKLLGRSKPIEDIRNQILKVAPTDFTIHIYGESGTGKELIARAIHENSRRSEKSFVAVDISALAPALVESELFGHVKGAFTGATETRPGYFSISNGGTLFLDEIANTSLDLQGKLLRVLDSRRVRPVGGKVEQEVDVRIVTATNKLLLDLVEQGKFREDLYYRLNVIPIVIPPLRERSEDIPLLSMHFLERANASAKTHVQGFSTEAMAKMIAYHWPGNVRQLVNVVERVAATVDGGLVRIEHLPPEISNIAPGVVDLGVDEVPGNAEELKQVKRRLKEMVYEQVERQFVLEALKRAGGNVSQAADDIGMQRTNLHALMRRYGIHSKE